MYIPKLELLELLVTIELSNITTKCKYYTPKKSNKINYRKGEQSILMNLKAYIPNDQHSFCKCTITVYSTLYKKENNCSFKHTNEVVNRFLNKL